MPGLAIFTCNKRNSPLASALPGFCTPGTMDSYTVFYTFATLWSAPIIAAYLTMVLFCKPLMRLIPKLELRKTLVAHNLICSVVSLYAVVVMVIGLIQVGSVFSMKKEEGLLRHGMHVYWLSKLYELLDTVFMVLRHRGRQISFLHVFHHSSITLLADWAYFLTPIAAIVPVLAMNSMIHVVMYGYYFLTTLYPLHNFTWKKRITQMQMIQFIIATCHGTFGYLYYGFCIYCILYGFSMLALFSNFYYHAFYLKRNSRSGPVKDADEKKQN